MKHSKEPWRESPCRGDAIISDKGENTTAGADDVKYYGGHLVAESTVREDRRRIIACVNVLASWTTDELEEILGRGSQIRKVSDGQ